MTYKPDSVLYKKASIIYLCGLPSREFEPNSIAMQFLVYLTLQHERFTYIKNCFSMLCALTAHFHPYPLQGGIFSVALSVKKQLLIFCPQFPKVRCSALSGLSSTPRGRDRTVFAKLMNIIHLVYRYILIWMFFVF